MPAFKTQPNHGLLVGWADNEKGAFPAPVWDEGGEGHFITVAPTGAGKGVSCIIPALLTWRGPAIVIDPKGENHAVTARRRRDMKQRVHVLDPFGITDCIQRASLNPFDMLGPLRTALFDDMRVLANAAIQEKAFGRNQDPYWNSRAQALTADAIRYCARNLPHATLLDVRQVIENYDGHAFADQNDGLPASFRTPPSPAHHAIQAPFTPVGMGSGRTRTSITSTAVDHLAFISSGPVADSLSRSTIDLKKVERGDPMTIYIVLPPDKLATHGKLLRLWLTTLLTALSRRGVAPRAPTLMLVDEAAQLGEMREIVSAITLMRGYGMKVWTFWQDLSQIRKVYPNDWESILNNCSFHQYFGASTPMAARLLQEYLGDTCPRPVTSLRPNQLALYQPGQKGRVVRTPNYLTDAMFQGLYDANPFHAAKPDFRLVDDDFDIEERDGATIISFPAREGL